MLIRVAQCEDHNGEQASLKEKVFLLSDYRFHSMNSSHNGMIWDQEGWKEIMCCYLYKTLITKVVAHLFMGSLLALRLIPCG